MAGEDAVQRRAQPFARPGKTRGAGMNRILLAYGATLVAFVCIDMVWLLVLARGYYRAQMGDLIAEKPVLPAALLFYVLFAIGLVIFGVIPGLRENSWKTALLYGALFGFFSYATYDLTNLAVVRNWPLALSVVDLAWGTVLAGTCAVIGYVAGSAVP